MDQRDLALRFAQSMVRSGGGEKDVSRQYTYTITYLCTDTNTQTKSVFVLRGHRGVYACDACGDVDVGRLVFVAEGIALQTEDFGTIKGFVYNIEDHEPGGSFFFSEDPVFFGSYMAARGPLFKPGDTPHYDPWDGLGATRTDS